MKYTKYSILKREISVIAMEQDIESKVRERVGQIQKDMILREQVKVLQNELGEGDSDAEFDEYRTRICACRLPEETEKKLLKDVDRLSRQPFGSAEASVLRNYLDTVLDMPWGVETKERVSVETARRRLDRDHYGLEKVKERILEFIAVRRLRYCQSAAERPDYCICKKGKAALYCRRIRTSDTGKGAVVGNRLSGEGTFCPARRIQCESDSPRHFK